MRRIFGRWLAPLVLALCGGLRLTSAQDIGVKDLHPGIGGNGATAPQLAPADAGDKAERPPPTLSFFAAVVALIIVLCLICAPSRKAEASSAK
jgi:hypothetical protein